ncbi:DUF3427 domain-containing protein [Microcella frigidaquae]|uniref:Superfamily II DNA or RNA helicase/HKD family nuclease n=1 Tax=Microcella frigidaquae TaxID=424758 RepID=A0A840X749_9MICO|nr:superfamily II DNA or RNA helicase/HKD family nuclease [Microcella frigidaquae]NHN44455.1 DUF3427 domain-containing protein [Microcella frigidaquae]
MSEPREDFWKSPLGRETEFGYLLESALVPHNLNPEVVLNNENSSVLRVLRRELKHAERFLFSVAFVTPRALTLLKQELVDFRGTGTIVTSDYLGFNSPGVFKELKALEKVGVSARIHSSKAFHAKGYIFRRPDRSVALFGSANLTESALVANLEWNIKVSGSPQSNLSRQLDELELEQLENSLDLTTEWIAEYETRPRPTTVWTPGKVAEAPTPIESPTGSESVVARFEPNAMQREALAAIERMRAEGKSKVLVVSATGTGKTALAAFHVGIVKPERFLFIVHREQILDRAIQEFTNLLGISAQEVGKLAGGSRQTDKRFVFATIQSLSRLDVLDSVSPDEFDYVVVDESHHVGAQSYRRVMDHLKPAFTIGLTATPERSDQSDVFELFNYNVAYEIRLQAALEADMLAPFHYFGVADVEFEDGTTTDDATTIERLASRLRAEHVVRNLELYGHAGTSPKGLIFCSRVDEATALSNELNRLTLHGRPLRTVALSGVHSVDERLQTVDKLERGELDYILTVDIFNEGVDIPSVNQVVMLRQTKSAIVFVQQLGRGLRKAPAKDYTIVIDFIGNYTNNYLIPIALFGDNSQDKESLRRRLIEAEERGVLANISSIRFDRIAQKRVLDSVAVTKLSSAALLKPSLEAMRSRLGRTPRLIDFAESDSTDPVVLATSLKHYPELLRRTLRVDNKLTDEQSRMLDFLGNEVLAAKRLAETEVLFELLRGRPLPLKELSQRTAAVGDEADMELTMSALRTLTFQFLTEAERSRYGTSPVTRSDDGQYRLGDVFRLNLETSHDFHNEIHDLLWTARSIIPRKYGDAEPFSVGRQYSRKDASRLLRWRSNMMGTIFGYKVDADTRTCPIFVTYHKAEDVTASTQYEDQLIDTRTMTWFTRSRRTLDSAEVKAIVSNSVEINVFAKKDDNDGTDFFYLGRAQATNAFQTSMSDKNNESIPVVRVTLLFDDPIPQGLFDYFQPSITE